MNTQDRELIEELLEQRIKFLEGLSQNIERFLMPGHGAPETHEYVAELKRDAEQVRGTLARFSAG